MFDVTSFASTSTPTMSHRDCIPSASLTNDALCLNASSVSSAFSHELMGPSVREDAGKQSRCQGRLCTVCQADRVSHHLEHVFPLKKEWTCKW